MFVAALPRLGAARSFLPRKVCVAAAQAWVSKGSSATHTSSDSAGGSGGASAASSSSSSSPGSNSSFSRSRSGTVRLSTLPLLQQLINSALDESNLSLQDLDGVVAVPSLADPHFMEAHHQATVLGLFQNLRSAGGKRPKPLWCRTIDTGGAGPISAVNAATTLIQANKADVIAVLAVDNVGSLDSSTFLERADQSCQNHASPLPSPVIPHGYSKVTEYQLNRWPDRLSRDQLRLVPVLQSVHAARHPEALTTRVLTLEEVQASREVAPNVSLLECARRADGGACIILASNHFLRDREDLKFSPAAGASSSYPVILGTGEASGPLWPPERICEEEAYFSCEAAMMQAYEDAQLSAADIDFFGLYDCFPVCLVRALEACGLAERGFGGHYVEESWNRYCAAAEEEDEQALEALLADPKWFPVNTHGGLLGYGAPWEVPAASSS